MGPFAGRNEKHDETAYGVLREGHDGDGRPFGSADVSMFLIEPYVTEPSIRSALGFMGLSSRWANVLFPGITVLTREFLQLELLHREMCRLRRSGKSRERVESELAKRSMHRALETEFNRKRDPESAGDAVTKMTYWQRYASMARHFKLWESRKALSSWELHDLVFRRSIPTRHRALKVEAPEVRSRRINHTGWYSQHRDKGCVRKTWWVRGEFSPSGWSDELRLARRLELGFIVWQTYFEICVALLTQKQAIPTKPIRTNFAQALRELKALSEEESPLSCDSRRLRRVAAQLLWIHDFELKGMLRWQAQASKLGDERLYRLYDQSMTVSDLASTRSRDLFAQLVHLHQIYCGAQGKGSAAYVERTGSGKFRPGKLPSLSVEFSGGRAGLFGYRLDQAVQLKNSVGHG